MAVVDCSVTAEIKVFSWPYLTLVNQSVLSQDYANIIKDSLNNDGAHETAG
jgi:hypothetical protein